VFDLWVQRWREKQARGDVVVVSYADDFVVGFEHRQEAERFLEELRERFAKFGLELHPDKTRLIPFGRNADRDWRTGRGPKPDTFHFLGFHSTGKTRKGNFIVLRQTMQRRMQTKLKELKQELWRRMHQTIPESHPLIAALARYGGPPEDEVRTVHRVISPLAAPPRVPRANRYIFAGLADRMVPRKQVRDLWEHWERPRVAWYNGTHLSFVGEAEVAALLREALATLRRSAFGSSSAFSITPTGRDREPAVDVNRLAGDVDRFLREQESDRIRDLFGSADSSGGNLRGRWGIDRCEVDDPPEAALDHRAAEGAAQTGGAPIAGDDLSALFEKPRDDRRAETTALR
jgi:hypothetical protein